MRAYVVGRLGALTLFWNGERIAWGSGGTGGFTPPGPATGRAFGADDLPLEDRLGAPHPVEYLGQREWSSTALGFEPARIFGAQQVLLHFAHGVARQVGDDHGGFGLFEAGEFVADGGKGVFGVQGHAFARG